MAKDILWFHALIWEALLLALDKELPKVIFAHGFFSIDGQKMSKSLGNIIDPLELVNSYGVDGIRYLLLTSFAFGNDGDVSLLKFNEKYNADLANGIGNLVSRIARLCENITISSIIKSSNSNLASDVEVFMKSYRPDEALKRIQTEITLLDRKIHEDHSWTMSGEGLKRCLIPYVQKILEIANNLEPFLPDTATQINEIFSRLKISKPPSLFPRKK